MKALVIKKVGVIALEEVADPKIKDQTDAIVKLTMTTICGTDLHSVRGTIPGYKPATVLGHEGVGIVEAIGAGVKNFKIGDRVIVPSTVGCGICFYCKQQLYSQCEGITESEPAFYGGPIGTGDLNGMQAEKVRVPFADVNLVKIPDSVSDEQAILLSDILPTAYMAAENAFPTPSDEVAVFGCGIVGQLTILCLKQMGVKKIFAVDHIPWRLKIAQEQGAHPINFDEVDPVKELKKLTNNRGPNKIIDAVGIDAVHPSGVAPWFKELAGKTNYKQEVDSVAPIQNPQGDNWIPGDAPSQVLRWAVPAVAKTGVISIIGVYTELLEVFPIGAAVPKNLTITMGYCNHRKYIPKLLDWVKNGQVDLLPFLTQHKSFNEIVECYQQFDLRKDGWLKVALKIK